ncbi:MAG TPA: helix-turn-helix domain-containing protein [Caproiciproducens sp.]|nr:helix-turn-helix domain-containing protein [Caproiciproducens sp.]
MYKVLLAEDEVEVLSAMLTTIQWKKYGFEVPIGCQDGKKAIEVLEGGFAPNLVITDICMPFVDGLELTRYISENLPDTIVVMLTGYDEFKYAHAAIQFKVFDYVLKPVTPNRMNELLSRFKQELDERELRSLENSTRIVSSYFLSKIVSQKLDSSTIEKYCRANRFTFRGNEHILVVLDVDLPAPGTVQESNNLELMRYGLFNMAQELSQKTGTTVAFQGKDGITNLIVGGADMDEAYATAVQLCNTITGAVKHGLGITASAGIGEPVRELSELYLSRRQAEKALHYRFFYGASSIIREADVEIKQTGGMNYNSCESRIVKSVKEMNRKNARCAITDLMSEFREYQIPFDKCVLYSQKLMMCIISLTNEVTGGMDAKTLEHAWENTDLLKVSNLDQLEKLLMNICKKAFDILEAVKNNTVVSQVVRAENYIRENFSDPDLSLNTLTEHLAISTSYFSAIFKAQTGSTFVEYLTHIRMEKAKQILAFTDRRTYEVAEDVGFTDPHYFSVAFKRVTGVTPKEYRENAGKGGAMEASV